MTTSPAELQLKIDTLPLFLSGLNTVLPLKVKNTEDQIWPAKKPNPVRVSYHWLMPDRSMAVFEGLRSFLPNDLLPGTTADIQAKIEIPATPGEYILQLTLMQEGVKWFEKAGFKPLEFTLQIQDSSQYLAAKISIWGEGWGGGYISLLYPNEFIRFPLRIENTSMRSWPHDGNTPVKVSYHWLNANRTMEVHDGLRTVFAEAITSDSACILPVKIQAPPNPGKYYLQLSLVQEGIAWFEQSPTSFQMLELQIEVVNHDSFDKIQQQEQLKLRQALAQTIVIAESYSWIERHDTLTTANIQKIQAQIAAWPHRPLISVIMPTYNTPATFLRAAIESVQQQIYPYWELCIADDASTDPQIWEILQEYAANDSRIKIVLRKQNGHISAASNSALELATGEYMALLDHDDMLAPHHLYFVVGEIINYPGTEWIYFDTDLTDAQNVRKHTHYREKPNLDLFLSVAIMGTHAVYRMDKVRQLGGFRIGYEGSQDHDLGLRMLDIVEWQHIRHIPYILNYWRIHSGSVAGKGLLAKPYALHAGIKAVQDYLNRHQIQATVTRNYSLPGYRVHYAIPSNLPLVSIIIPTRNRLALIKACTASIWEKTTYPNYEIIIVNNDSDDENTIEHLNYWQQEGIIRVLNYPGKFNYSAINNYAVKHAKGELICLLNNDTEVISENWLTEMVSHALRPEIGIVGARLWYANNTIQHAGVLIKNNDLGHIGHRRQKPISLHTDLTRNLSAVTGACMVMRKAVFQEVGGLNARWLPISYNDIDLCFKVRQIGLKILYTPYAELYHHESISRGKDDVRDGNKWRNYMLCNWPEMFLPDQLYRENERHIGLRRKIKIYNPGVPKLLFLHIPKTAGVSFRNIVAKEYAGDELFVFVPKLLLECYAQSSNALTLARQYVRTAKAVFSHFWFGIHHLLELERVAYITILRHPIERTLSHYNHLIQETPPQMLQGMSIAGMLRKGIIPENFMTRIISGEKLDTVTWNEIDNGPFAYFANFVGFGMPPEVWRGELDSLLQQSDIPPRNDPEVLKTALQNIHEHFACVGLIDNIADVVAKLGQHLDWSQHPIIPKLGENSDKLIKELDAVTIKVIEEYNQLDMQLYEYIRNLPESCFIKDFLNES